MVEVSARGQFGYRLNSSINQDLAKGQSRSHWPMFSPDGRWIAYYSNESGVDQVYVRAFPDKGGKRQVSVNGGFVPMWSQNGGELFFLSFDGHPMVATYATKRDSFAADEPRIWSPVVAHFFDVAPDGKRIAAPVRLETLDTPRAQSHVVFLLNFYDELRRKVPVK
jgi:Tol biopolymer transport system component